MAKTNVENVRNFLKCVGTVHVALIAEDADCITGFINPDRYIEHRPNVSSGAEGLKNYLHEVAREGHSLRVVRTVEDGQYVVAHSEGLILGQGAFFDVFRLENGLIVEHWGFSTAAAPPNQSGHTQTDGPTDISDADVTEKNKSIVEEYYETIHISGEHDRIPLYFSGDFCIRHEPGVRDGVENFKQDLERLVKNRSIDKIKLILGQGDFVFIAAVGSHEERPCNYLDLYRVKDEKIVERWGFPQEVPPQAEWKNTNGEL